MKLEVYAVHDKVVGAFTQPFMCRSRGEAIRSFTTACNEEKSNFRTHYMDYALFQLAVYDDTTGEYVSNVQRVVLAAEVIVDEVIVGADAGIERAQSLRNGSKPV